VANGGARCEAKKTATGCVEEEPEPEKGVERVWNLKWRAPAGGIGLGFEEDANCRLEGGGERAGSLCGFAVWSTVPSRPIIFYYLDIRLDAARRLAQR